MTTVREVTDTETALVTEAMLELRPHLASANACIRLIDEVQRAEGYRVVGAFLEGREQAAGCAGFRIQHHTAWGKTLYVDDLSTVAACRRQGHAAALFGWLVAEARRHECNSLHLDSGPTRHDAHRFYLNQGLALTSHHFSAALNQL